MLACIVFLVNVRIVVEFFFFFLSSVLQQTASSDEDVIPGTPVLHSSLPVGGKLRRHRRPEHAKRVRYAEKPLPWSGSSLFNGQRPHLYGSHECSSPLLPVLWLLFSQKRTRSALIPRRNLRGTKCSCQTRVCWTHLRSQVGYDNKKKKNCLKRCLIQTLSCKRCLMVLRISWTSSCNTGFVHQMELCGMILAVELFLLFLFSPPSSGWRQWHWKQGGGDTRNLWTTWQASHGTSVSRNSLDMQLIFIPCWIKSHLCTGQTQWMSFL